MDVLERLASLEKRDRFLRTPQHKARSAILRRKIRNAIAKNHRLKHQLTSLSGVTTDNQLEGELLNIISNHKNQLTSSWRFSKNFFGSNS